MGHTPFGYRIENGKAVIDEATAAQVRDLYKNYPLPMLQRKPGSTYSILVPSA